MLDRSTYPDADYLVVWDETEAIRATITNNVFRYFPRGVFRHTTVNGLSVTSNTFTDFGRSNFITDLTNLGNSYTRSVITVTENAALAVPAAFDINSNVISNIRYVTFVNVRSTRGRVTINSNTCQNGLCGWTNDYSLPDTPLYVDADSSLHFVKVILAKSTIPRTITIKSNTFKSTVQTPVSDLVIRGRFKKTNPLHDTFTGIGVSGDATAVTFDVKSNTITGYPTRFRVPDITNTALQTNYNPLVLVRNDEKKYIREWLVVNSVQSINMDIWRVANAVQYLYLSITNDYCHVLCPADVKPTTVIDYCIVNPMETQPISYVYYSLPSALSNCRVRGDGVREIRLTGGNYTLTYNFVNIPYKLRPQYQVLVELL